MARLKDFNPKGVVVVRRQSGLSLGGRLYERGEAVDDDCISLRKKLQLYRQNILCHPYEIEEVSVVVTPVEVVDPVEFDDRDDEDFFEDETYFDDEDDSEDVKPEADNGDDAEAEKSEKVSETQESEEEIVSEEITAPKRRRLRNPKSSKTKAA